MFTGIIETVGRVVDVVPDGGNLTLTIQSELSENLSIDQSVSHNGACLTVVEVNGDKHKVTAIEETLTKSNLKNCKPGEEINLETALSLKDKLDGHIVQGHVDTVATCIQKNKMDGSHLFTFRFSERFGALIIEKGSIAVNGVSLTAFDVTKDLFTVAIIPYTMEHTTFKNLSVGDEVNLEFDILGKYILRAESLKEKR